MRKTIVLCDSDSVYAARFMEYFKNKQDFDWDIAAFTNTDKLVAYLQGHMIEILLVGSKEILEAVTGEPVPYRYLLTEERQEAFAEGGIFRYQSVERIMEQILTDYVRKQKEQTAALNPKHMNIITIFSPISDGQDASFAWSLGFQLARQRKVLFIPLELYPIKSLEFVDQSRQALSEFMYYLKEDSNIIIKLKELLHYSNNLSYLTGASHGFDLLSLNKEDIQRWITMLRTNTDYHSVIFYLSFYQEAGMELLRLSDSAVLIKGQTPYEQEVFKEWERQQECIGIDLQQQRFTSMKRIVERGVYVTYHSLQELSNSPVWQQAQEYLKIFKVLV